MLKPKVWRRIAGVGQASAALGILLSSKLHETMCWGCRSLSAALVAAFSQDVARSHCLSI